MTKLKFLMELNNKLSSLPQDDVEERLSFYSEMIEDRMEEGLSEEEAVAAVGSIDEIAEQIKAEVPIVAVVKEKIKPKRSLKGWEILLIILGFPLWLPLLIAAFAVLFGVFVSFWSIIISLWAVFVSFVACFMGGLIGGIILIIFDETFSGAFLISASLICAGLSIFAFYACKLLTKAMIWLTKRVFFGTKKGEAK